MIGGILILSVFLGFFFFNSENVYTSCVITNNFKKR